MTSHSNPPVSRKWNGKKGFWIQGTFVLEETLEGMRSETRKLTETQMMAYNVQWAREPHSAIAARKLLYLAVRDTVPGRKPRSTLLARHLGLIGFEFPVLELSYQMKLDGPVEFPSLTARRSDAPGSNRILHRFPGPTPTTATCATNMETVLTMASMRFLPFNCFSPPSSLMTIWASQLVHVLIGGYGPNHGRI